MIFVKCNKYSDDPNLNQTAWLGTFLMLYFLVTIGRIPVRDIMEVSNFAKQFSWVLSLVMNSLLPRNYQFNSEGSAHVKNKNDSTRNCNEISTTKKGTVEC